MLRQWQDLTTAILHDGNTARRQDCTTAGLHDGKTARPQDGQTFRPSDLNYGDISDRI